MAQTRCIGGGGHKTNKMSSDSECETHWEEGGFDRDGFLRGTSDLIYSRPDYMYMKNGRLCTITVDHSGMATVNGEQLSIEVIHALSVYVGGGKRIFRN
jgi:hypothetical protein